MKIKELHITYEDGWGDIYPCPITRLALEMPECAELLHKMIDDVFECKGTGLRKSAMTVSV